MVNPTATARSANNVVNLGDDSEPEVVLDRRKLSSGAAAIRDKLSLEDRKKIADAKPLTCIEAAKMLHDHNRAVPMQDVRLAVIFAGMEKAGESEVTITNMLNNMQAAFPQLEKRWLKDLRKAVLYIQGSKRRAAAKGEDTNVVNDDDFLALCSYGAKKIESDNEPNPTLFKRGDTFAVIATDTVTGTARVKTLTLSDFKAKANLIAPYRKRVPAGEDVAYQGVSMPHDVAEQLFRHDFDLPELRDLTTTPVFVGNGDLVSMPGYHRAAGIYYAKQEGLMIPDIPRRVATEHVAEARRILIEELLGDFELDGVSRQDLMAAALGGDAKNPPPASVLNAIGAVTEQSVRPMIDGPLMPHLITKTAKGAGGGLLSNAIQIIVEGTPSSRPMPKYEEERRKGLTTAYKSGARFICYDNIAGELSSPSLATATTEPVWSDRILGRSDEVSIPIRSSHMLVGIRPLLSDELRRRMNLIEMKPQTAKPEDRKDFRHEDLLAYVRANRGDFIWAVLVLAKNWIQKGCPAPKHAPVIGSYHAYRYVIGGIIEAAAANWTTWQGNRAALDEIASDGEDEEIVNLLCAWWHHGELANAGTESSDLCALAEERKITLPLKRVPHGEEFEYSPKSMGRYLKGYMGRHFMMDDGTEVELSKSTTRGNGGYPWVLAKVDPKQKHDVVEQTGGSRIGIKREKPAVNALLKSLSNGEAMDNPF